MPPLQPLATTAQKAAKTATAVRTQRDDARCPCTPPKRPAACQPGIPARPRDDSWLPSRNYFPDKADAVNAQGPCQPATQTRKSLENAERTLAALRQARREAQRLCGLQASAATPAASCTSTSWSSASGSGQPVRVASIRSRSSSRAQSAPSTAPGRRELVSDRFGPTQAASPRSQIEVRAPVEGP